MGGGRGRIEAAPGIRTMATARRNRIAANVGTRMRMADHGFSDAATWGASLRIHEQWVDDVSDQAHRAHRRTLLPQPTVENPRRGDGRLQGELAKLGHLLGRSTIRGVLKRRRVPPAPGGSPSRSTARNRWRATSSPSSRASYER